MISHWQYINISKKVFQNKLNNLKLNAFKGARLGKSLSVTITLSYSVASVFHKTFFFIADDVSNALAFSSVVSLMKKVWQYWQRTVFIVRKKWFVTDNTSKQAKKFFKTNLIFLSKMHFKLQGLEKACQRQWLYHTLSHQYWTKLFSSSLNLC